MASTLEARLQYLETREEAHTRDIIRLKTENADLLNKVCDLKRENVLAAEKMGETDFKVKKIEKENAELQTKVCEMKQERALAAAKPVEVETKVKEVESKGNANLVTKVWELRQEMILTVAKLEGAETKIQKVENDMRAVFGFRENIDNRLSCVESKFVVVKEAEDRLSSLESVMNDLRQEVTGYRALSVSEKGDHQVGEACGGDEPAPPTTSTSGHAVDDRLEKMENDWKSSHETVENRLKKVELSAGSSSQASDQSSQALTTKMDEIERKTLETETIVRKLIQARDAISKSVTRVRLSPKHKPKTGVRVLLVKCVQRELEINGGYFNVNTCRLEPPVGGDFVITMDYFQDGDGILSFYVDYTGNQSPNGMLFAGSTFDSIDACSFTFTVRLNKGDQVWFGMRRIDGNADLSKCIVTSWLLSPSLI